MILQDVTIFIQARSNSTRLPNKAKLRMVNVPMIELLYQEARRVTENLYLLIPTGDPIRELAIPFDGNVIEGPEDDVLTRFYIAALQVRPNYILRLTGDCPLISERMIREFIASAKYMPYQNNRGDHEDLAYADGFDMELFSYGFLEYCNMIISKPEHREHVCFYHYEYVMDKFSIDTEEDYLKVKDIYETRKFPKGVR